jgi:hypothetical protein
MTSHSHSARVGSVIFVCSQCHPPRVLSPTFHPGAQRIPGDVRRAPAAGDYRR